MNVTAPAAATLLQALIGPDTAAPADPAAPAAGGDFAMMMAGVATPPAAPAEDAAAGDDITNAAARDQDDGDSGADEAPDAVLLAMMAITPPPASAQAPAAASADVQAPATISAAALATARDAAVPGTAARADPAATPSADSATGSPAANGVAPPPVAAVPPDPTDSKLMPATPADAAQQPASATAAIRKVIAGLLGLKPSAPVNAPELIASAGAARQEASGSRHSHPVAAATATTDDDHADADAPAIAIAPAGGTIAAIAVGGVATSQGDTGATAPHHPAADVSAQLGEHHIALAQGDGWLDQLARDISSTAAPDGKLHFRLNPERLGSLQVEVARGAEGAAVRLTADSRATRDILVEAQPQLAAQAQAQGVRIAGTHVDLGAGTSGGQTGGRQEHVPVPQVRALGIAAVSTATEPARPRSAASERYA